MTRPLRTFLWVLGGLGVAWLVLGLTMLPAMGGMMDGGMIDGGMMGGEAAGSSMNSMSGMGRMMALMLIQFLAMLGLVVLFVYLVVDSLRRRRGV